MGKIVLYVAASVDGFIARSDGDVSWLDKYQSAEEDYGYHDFHESIGACIMGANTYEKALTLTGGIDKKLPTYVVTQRKLPAQADAEVILHSGSLSDLLRKIRKRTKKDIWLVGGGRLTQSFLKEKLLDEIVLSTIPMVLGEGISLFGNTRKEVDLRLVETRVYEIGIVQTHYRVQK